MANAEAMAGERFFFSGTVAEAIQVAKAETKQVVVCVAGENDDSRQMESVTWPQAAAAGSLKNMLVLRLQEGSVDAANFDAFCKINKSPTVAVIEPSGERVYWHEGFITCEDLVKGVAEGTLKAQLAKAMAAMLHSNPGIATSSSQNSGNAQGNSGSNPTAPAQTVQGRERSAVSGEQAGGAQEPQRGPQAGDTVFHLGRDGELREYFVSDDLEDSDSDSDPEATGPSPGPTQIEEERSEQRPLVEQPQQSGQHSLGDLAQSAAKAKREQKPAGPKPPERASGSGEQKNTVPSVAPEHEKDAEAAGNSLMGSVEQRKRDASSQRNQGAPSKAGPKKSPPLSSEPNKSKAQSQQKEKLPSPISEPTTTVIQFRLTNGESMRGEFDLHAPLWDARAWLDANRNDSGSSYDLAIPFPKRTLTDADLDKSFKELQLFPRASLLLISKRFSQVTARQDPQGAGITQNEQAGLVGGVTRAVGGLLGYLNPFSYFGGAAPAETEAARQPPWEYGPNPQLEQALRSRGPGTESSAEPPSGVSNSGRRFATLGSSQSGPGTQRPGGTITPEQTRKRGAGSRGNIHGLDHSSEEQADPRRNNFWNGNSTQFGSNEDKNQ